MKKKLLFLGLLFVSLVLAACGSDEASTDENGNASGGGDRDTLTIAWYPNESGAELKGAREEIGAIVEEATGKKVEHQTTTDYLIAIEALANGNADLAFMGAVGYIEANEKNNEVQPLVVPSGSSGTLDDAIYYSWLAVNKGDEVDYKDGDAFAIDNIAGKRFSFVSNSSTSGFVVPSSGIVDYFSQKSDFSDLTQEDLLEGGEDNFFSEVLFGGSHQGSAMNLLTDKVDVAAFCDTCVGNYIELAEGEENRPGAVYRVLDDAAEPFHMVPGKEFSLISVTPVLNAPIAVNTGTVSEGDIQAMREALTSDNTTNNENIFIPEDSEFDGLFSQGQKFLEVEDTFFDPIRELSN